MHPGTGSGFMDELRELIRQHSVALGAEASQLAEEIGAISHARMPDALEAVRRRAHQIKGSSGMIGFDEVSACAGRIEQLAKGLSNATGEPAFSEIAVLREVATQLQDIVASISPEMSSLHPND